MDFSGNYTPRPIEIVMLNDELDKYIGNDFNVNLSMASNQPQEEIKFKKMKKVIMKQQLKSLIQQLLEIIRDHNKLILNQFRKQGNILLQSDFLDFFEKIQTTWRIGSEKFYKQIKGLKQELQNVKEDRIKYQNYNSELRKQFQFNSEKINSLQKHNNRLNQENFCLQKTIQSLKQKIQQIESKHSEQKQSSQTQIQNLLQSIESLQLVIESKQNNIECLQNSLRKSKQPKLQDGQIIFQLMSTKQQQRVIQSPPKLQHRLSYNSKQTHYQYKSPIKYRSINTSPNRRSRSKDRMSFEQMQRQLSNLKVQISIDLNKISKKR